jgi:hypothetical protein
VILDELARAWDQLVGRLSGPMAFRFLMQPVMAACIAIRAGVRDARAHRPPFLLTAMTRAADRPALLRSLWRDVCVVFFVALMLDAIYQVGVLRTFFPLQAITVAGLVAFVPYALTRGLVTRFVERHHRL